MADKLQVRRIDDLTPVAETFEILTSFLLMVLVELRRLLDCSISVRSISTLFRRPLGPGIRDTHTYTRPNVSFLEYLSAKKVWAILQVGSASAY
jgi:hypothetical protein